MLDFAIFAVTAIVCLIVAIIYLYPGTKRVTTIPGPDISDPLEGNLPDLAAAGSLHEFLSDLHGHYGSIVHFWWGPQLTVSIASPELFKEHSGAFDRPALIFELFRAFISGDSIQYANGVEGRTRHTAYSRLYSHEAVSNYFSIFQKMVDEVVAEWKKKPADEHIDVAKYTFMFSIKSMLLSSFGKYFKGEKEVLSLKKSYDIVWSDLEKQLQGEKLEEGTPRVKVFDKECENIRATLLAAFKEAKNNPPGPGEPDKLVDVMVKMKQSEAITIADMVSTFVGGFHTTGNLLTWALYFLADNPEVQSRLHDEVTTVLETEKVTPQSIKHLPYLRQVIDETLRCSILAPFAARVQDFDSELGGHIIPKGTPVIHALGVVLSDPNIWPEPEQFDPDRFSEENSGNIPAHAFEPFGFAGKRKCPGYRFGYAEASVFLAEVVRNFEISLIDGQYVVPEFGLVTSPRENVWITVKARK